MLAIAGVVVGALLAFIAQLLLRRGEDVRDRRRERLEACATFAAAAENARGAQYDRWWSKHEMRSESQRTEAKDTSYQRRTAMRVAQSRLGLLELGDSVLLVAAKVVRQIGDLHKSESQADLEENGGRALMTIDDFTRAAALELRPIAASHRLRAFWRRVRRAPRG